MNVRELLKAIGSQNTIAKRLGVTESLPAHWIKRGTIPLRYWQGILKMADEKGVEINLQTIYQVCVDGIREGDSI